MEFWPQTFIPQYLLLAEIAEKVCHHFATIMRENTKKGERPGYKIWPLLI
jgi:hypothetical protein